MTDLDTVLPVLHRVAEITVGDPEAVRAVLGELGQALQRQGDKDERLLRGDAVDADVADAERAALKLFCYWPEVRCSVSINEPLHPKLDSAFRSISDDLLQRIDAVCQKENLGERTSEVECAISAWFGDDMYDAYLNWVAEDETR